MKNLYLVMFFGLFFTGCINLNLRSELPEINYYTLDSLETTSTEPCGAYNYIALGAIDIPSEYQGNKILQKNDLKAHYINEIKLIKGLNESLESMIIKEFNKQCIKTIIPPFSGINVENYLKIKLLDFSIDKNVANVAIFYQISQKGAILQSGIIAESSEIESNNEKPNKEESNKNDSDLLDSKVKALRDSSFEVVHKLANKIIPK